MAKVPTSSPAAENFLQDHPPGIGAPDIESSSGNGGELHQNVAKGAAGDVAHRSEEHTSELQSLMRISYAVFCLKKKNHKTEEHTHKHQATLPNNQHHLRKKKYT